MLIPEFFYHQFFTTPSLPTTPLTGQTVIITGSNRGLGLSAAQHVVRLGAAKLILAVRSLSSGQDARSSLLKLVPAGKDTQIEVWELDMSSYDSVKAFAKRAENELERIDALLHNAGLSTSKFARKEGEEQTLTVNVLSVFLLTLLLLPKLRASATQFGTTPRVSVVGSETMNWVSFKEKNAPEHGIFAAMNDENKTDMSERYYVSKLLVMFCVRQLARAMDTSSNNNNNSSEGSRVILNAPAPGFVATELSHEQRASAAFRAFEKVVARNVEEGSRCVVFGVCAGRESHGQYLSEGKVKPVGKGISCKKGEETGRRVWAKVLGKLEAVQPGIGKNI